MPECLIPGSYSEQFFSDYAVSDEWESNPRVWEADLGFRLDPEDWPTLDYAESLQPPGNDTALLECIASSRAILELNDDWDGEGSVGYLPATWQRATSFLKRLWILADLHLLSITLPRIAPADEGSIDLHWDDPSRELLINIPADTQEAATYYGRNQNGETIAGPLQTEDERFDIVLWLTRKR